MSRRRGSRIPLWSDACRPHSLWQMYRWSVHSTRVVELTFLRDPFKSLFGALDTVLMLAAIGRQQFHDLIGPIRSHVTEGFCCEMDRLTKSKLVCVQR
jgi:hypothetical protein